MIASGPILTFASRFSSHLLRMLESKDHKYKFLVEFKI
ncbi:hypothetical protein V1291_002587 [Nitrobacteraceae bacterium AZCC 1564]